MRKIKNKKLVFAGGLVLSAVLIVWGGYVPYDETQIIHAGREEVYRIKPCNNLRLDVQQIAGSMKGDEVIEIRAGKGSHYVPFHSGQFIYDLGSNLIPGEGIRDPFRGFEKGQHYIIAVRIKDSGAVWSSRIDVAENLFARIFYFPVGGITLGGLMLISVVSAIVIYPFYLFVFQRRRDDTEPDEGESASSPRQTKEKDHD